MIFVNPEFERIVDTQNGMYNTLVIENQALLVRLVRDICNQIQGSDGESVLSRNYTPVAFPQNAELIDTFVPFDLNRKPLLTKLASNLAKQAVSPELYESTSMLLAGIERHLSRIAFDFPWEIDFPGVSIASIIKVSAPEIHLGVENLAEKVYNYMELVRELDSSKLFITLNMRSFVSDDDMEFFSRTAVLHGFDILAIENREYPKLSMEKRTIIDKDLCEF